MNTSYSSYKKATTLEFQEAVPKTKEAPKKEGFGAISEFDLKAKFREKLDKDIDDYIILGACNPGLAFKALQAEQDIVLLPPYYLSWRKLNPSFKQLLIKYNVCLQLLME